MTTHTRRDIPSQLLDGIGPKMARWVRDGMFCIQDETGIREVKNCPSSLNSLLAVGCGGWDKDGKLWHVGIDFDVGHGGKHAHASMKEALKEAKKVRRFVGNAAEIRLSKSGKGVHVRIAIKPSSVKKDGRKYAALIAKWIAKKLNLKCDPTVLGRQNLWFWAKARRKNGFEQIAPAKGAWSPPRESLQESNSETSDKIVHPPDASSILRAREWVKRQAPSISGKGGHDQCFSVACGLISGFGLSLEYARILLKEYNSVCMPPWSDREIEHKLADAKKKADKKPERIGYLLLARETTYLVKNGCIMRRLVRAREEQFEPLCNFTARITVEEKKTDGAETTKLLTLEGKSEDGKPFPPATVTMEEFCNSTWAISKWGVKAIVYPRAGEHLKVALQSLSTEIEYRTIYAHTGWMEINRKKYYLQSGGAIGAKGLRTNILVDLPDSLRSFRLEHPPNARTLKKVVRKTLDLFKGLAPDEIIFPLIAAVFRASFGGSDFSLFFYGTSGTFKTSIAALGQQFYGREFERLNLPAHFQSTANATEGLAFVAKDALLVVDDYAPPVSKQAEQKLHRDAERIFRAQGNNTGRGRMRPDGTLRPAKPPRGLILATGEDVPPGTSLNARLVIVEFQKGNINLQELNRAQSRAARGVFEKCMSAFLQYCARKPKIGTGKAAIVNELRQKVPTAQQHTRVPENTAQLGFGLKSFLDFANDAKAISPKERDELWQRGWNALLKVAQAQKVFQRNTNPASFFLSLICSVLSSGRAHLQRRDGRRPKNPQAFGWRSDGVRWICQGPCIGWASDDGILLDPQAAFAAAQKMATDQGAALSISQTTLHKRLNEGGHLSVVCNKRQTLTVRKTISGHKRVVLILKRSSLFPEKPAKPDNSRSKIRKCRLAGMAVSPPISHPR